MDSISKYEENQEYYENLDKRTKEYKAYSEWKENQEASSKGLGDTIEKITEATGIKSAVEFLAGEDCGCDKRKEKLNNLFSYRKPLCFTEDEYNFISEFLSQGKSVIDMRTQKRLLNVYNRVFQARRQYTTCAPCLKQIVDEIKKYFEAYQ